MSKASVNIPVEFQPDSLAGNISDLYSSWHTARQPQMTRIAEVIKYVYATSTKETTNASNPWNHTTHIPKLTQIHDNLGANYATALFGAKEFFTFDPGSPEAADVEKRNAIKSYLTTKHEYNGFIDTMKQLLDDWKQTGNCFGRLEYVVEKALDPVSEVEDVVYEGPKLFRISPYDIEFDLTANSFAEAPKIICSLMTIGEFLRRNEENVNLQWDQSVVQKCLDWRGYASGVGPGKFEKMVQAQMDGFTSYNSYLGSGKLEILEFFGDIYDPYTKQLHKDSMITVVDRRWVLRNLRASEYGNIGHIYHCGWRKRPDNLWAQGPLDNLVGMQYLIDHLENARADGFDQMLNPDEVYVGQVETRVSGPVRRHYIDDGEGSVTKLPPDAQVLQADFQIQIKEAQMEAYAGAPREAMGIRSPGEKTAFEVESLQNAAARLFQVKIEDFESQFVEPILNGEIELAIRNISGSDQIKTMDDDLGIEAFALVNKADLAQRGRIKARGAAHFGRRSQLVRELQQFGQMLAADQALAMHFPALKRAKLLSDAMDLDKYGIMEPFGAIAESVDAQKFQQAAAQAIEQFAAAEEVAAEVEGG